MRRSGVFRIKYRQSLTASSWKKVNDEIDRSGFVQRSSCTCRRFSACRWHHVLFQTVISPGEPAFHAIVWYQQWGDNCRLFWRRYRRPEQWFYSDPPKHLHSREFPRLRTDSGCGHQCRWLGWHSNYTTAGVAAFVEHRPARAYRDSPPHHQTALFRSKLKQSRSNHQFHGRLRRSLPIP